MFTKEDNAIIWKKGYETLRIEGWGADSLRVRCTMNTAFSGEDWALSEKPAAASSAAATSAEAAASKTAAKVSITVSDDEAGITNGKLSATVSANGVLRFFKDGKLILREYYRNYDAAASRESVCLKVVSREFHPVIGGSEFRLTVRFDANEGEQIFGMGQYQQPNLDMKGCVLELAQRNSQTSIPFYVSSLGYGFLWNNPSVGRATFGTNRTVWESSCCDEMDYWITAADSPAAIMRNYTGATGRHPLMGEDYLGFWQCKLRYRTQDEVLTVARKYRELGIKLDVIVIDFFHWIRQGDWGFDRDYWPDPKAMCDELHAMGTKVMVSVWPSVDKKCSHFQEMWDRGLLVRTDRGVIQTYDFNGDCVTFDATNPEAREFIWKVCKESYQKYGIDMFWLDNAEPDLSVYDYELYRYRMGPALKVSNLYPKCYAQAFWEGMRESGMETPVNLERCAWAGSQKYGVILWNGDVQSSWECLQDSVAQGLGMGLSGIAWWTTDIGGFMWGNVHDKGFIELLERWFEWAVFMPIMRLHGDRDPHDIPPLSDKDYGGGYLFTGSPNEIWCYGEEAQKIFEKNIRLRESLKGYVASLMKEAHESGAPLMRTMFYEFPEDEECWKLKDQYMFGPDYLVAPVLHAGETERELYLPAGSWEDFHTGEKLSGGRRVKAAAPIDRIPVFRKL